MRGRFVSYLVSLSARAWRESLGKTCENGLYTNCENRRAQRIDHLLVPIALLVDGRAARRAMLREGGWWDDVHVRRSLGRHRA